MILNQSDEVLMSQRFSKGVHHMKWSFPSGYLEFGESFEECIASEVMEEA